jgi:hypothetical protein
MMHALGVAFMKMGILCTGWLVVLFEKKGGARNGGEVEERKKLVTNRQPATQPKTRHPTLNHTMFLHSFRGS